MGDFLREALTTIREYLQDNPLPFLAESMNSLQALIFAFMKNELVKRTNLISDHVAWHQENGIGGKLFF